MNLPRLSLLALLLASCSRADKKAQHSFYYWKTAFGKGSDTAFISKEKIDHFYIHYFDVAWSNEYNIPVPVAEISGMRYAEAFIKNHYTPVVFITNNCFEKIDTSWCDSLAVKVCNRIKYISNHLEETLPEPSIEKGKHTIDEIQIDCDWTASTKEKYFIFLKKIKSLFPGKKISATIRLYPYKYPVIMGVPPVDKGLLMCYNITDIKDSGNPNSVFSIEALKQYLNAKEYPLPLDIALPVFGWYAWFSNEKFKNIIYPGPDDALATANQTFTQNGNKFTLRKDTLLNNNYLRQGDVLRMEYPADAELESAAKLLRDKFPNTARICFYHWDKNLVKKYEKTIHHIYARF